MKQVTKYLIEVLVIIFSILAAFFLENYREDIQQDRQAEEAMNLLHKELKTNEGILLSNLQVLEEFNAYVVLMDSLFGEVSPGTEMELSRTDWEDLNERYASNQRVVASMSDRGGRYRIIYEPAIDFFLTPFDFSMWESCKFSGVLIGQDPELLGAIQGCYLAFATAADYRIDEYNEALISPSREYEDLDRILDTAWRLEQALRIKKIFLSDRIERLSEFLDQD